MSKAIEWLKMKKAKRSHVIQVWLTKEEKEIAQKRAHVNY